MSAEDRATVAAVEARVRTVLDRFAGQTITPELLQEITKELIQELPNNHNLPEFTCEPHATLHNAITVSFNLPGPLP